MSLLDNHFSRSIGSSLSPETKAAIGYGRNISDEDAMDRLIRDLSASFGIFDIQRDKGGYTARRMAGIGLYGETFHAKNRHDLQAMMVKDAGSALHVVLTEQGYKGYNIVSYLRRYWGIPRALGHVNLTHQEERERKGILVADSNDAIHAAIDNAVGQEECGSTDFVPAGATRWADPVLLKAGYRGYNIVGYLDRVWSIPVSFGDVNVRLSEVRNRYGVLSAGDVDALQRAVDASFAKLVEHVAMR